MEIELTIRDLYMEGTDTLILKGKAAERYSNCVDTTAFLTSLETVDFSNPYVVKTKVIKT